MQHSFITIRSSPKCWAGGNEANLKGEAGRWTLSTRPNDGSVTNSQAHNVSLDGILLFIDGNNIMAMERPRRRSHDVPTSSSSSSRRPTTSTPRRRPSRELTATSSSSSLQRKKLEVGHERSCHHRKDSTVRSTSSNSRAVSSSSSHYPRQSSSRSSDITTGGKYNDRASRTSNGSRRERGINTDSKLNSTKALPTYSSSRESSAPNSVRHHQHARVPSRSASESSRTTRRSDPPPLPLSSPPPRVHAQRDASKSNSSRYTRLLSSMSFLESSSSKRMSSSCPILSMTPDEDEWKLGTNLNHARCFSNSETRNHRIVPPVDLWTSTETVDRKSTFLLKNATTKTASSRKVSKMSYIDPFGDAGLYTGEVDEDNRPHGKGKMKYDNGIYFEGTWVYGCKNDCMGLKSNGISTMGAGRESSTTSSCVQQSIATRERILSGFTSWKGKFSTDSSGSSGETSGSFAYGMDWVDRAGLSGKYTGRVDKNDVPDGRGVMRYHFGLVAEGDWIKGVLNNGAGTAGVNPFIAGSSGAITSGAMSIAPGMSVVGEGGGAMSVVSGLGMTSIGGGAGARSMGMCSYPPSSSVAAGVYKRMVNPYANMLAAMPSAPSPMVAVGNPMGMRDVTAFSSITKQ